MMNDRPDSRQPPAHRGLCASCRRAIIVTSDRGAEFVRCTRAQTDPGFPKYPRLPVLRCRGYDPDAPPLV
jgi:LSD1 subclass zinc finger protein